MNKDFNLLVSCPRFHETDAIAEMWYLLSNIGDNEAKSEQTVFPGLIVTKTSLEPLQAVKSLRTLIEEDPLILKFVLKIMPIEVIVGTTLENITKVVAELGARIMPTETFRITAKSRYAPIESQDLILKAAKFIDRKVNLTNPDKILLIQILGSITGLALVQPKDIILKVEYPI